MDFGIKNNIIRYFKKRNCKLTVFPATATAEEVLSVNPDLVFLIKWTWRSRRFRFCYRKYKEISWKETNNRNLFRTSTY